MLGVSAPLRIVSSNLTADSFRCVDTIRLTHFGHRLPTQPNAADLHKWPDNQIAPNGIVFEYVNERPFKSRKLETTEMTVKRGWRWAIRATCHWSS